MGQSQSRTEEIINSSSSCRTLSDKQVVFYIKQYFTLQNVIDILIDVEDGKIREFEPATKYLIDLYQAIPDIMESVPSDLSIEVYQPKEVTAGIYDNKPVVVFSTALHEYNDFVLKENKVMTPEKMKEKAQELREKMVTMGGKLLEYISQYCSDVGINEV